MIELVEQHREAIQALGGRYGVSHLDLFGSAATGDFDPATSDLDFVATFVDTDVPGFADRYFGFVDALEALLGRPVDVVTEEMIRSPYLRQAVEQSRQLIHHQREAPAAA